ncbi:RecX family transcriptional regulator [Candidatus Saccharibacteria bacterium]|nr:RecX family transcriptional regulator [Candidatus Saccharibacteria bacterium]
MEIYKLKDNTSAARITDIKQAVRNENRVNIYVNGEYSFSLDIAQVVELGVKVGKSITEAELAEFKKASEFGKVYQRALEWVLMRPRSVRELRDYLKRRALTSAAKERKHEWEAEKEGKKVHTAKARYNFDDLIVERLTKRGYVDDVKFAKYFVENRFVKKGVSGKRLSQELMKKGISKDIIEDVLGDSARNDEEEILKIIAKKRAKYDDAKLIQYLCRQGFSYELSRELVARSSETD